MTFFLINIQNERQLNQLYSSARRENEISYMAQNYIENDLHLLNW